MSSRRHKETGENTLSKSTLIRMSLMTVNFPLLLFATTFKQLQVCQGKKRTLIIFVAQVPAQHLSPVFFPTFHESIMQLRVGRRCQMNFSTNVLILARILQCILIRISLSNLWQSLKLFLSLTPDTSEE